MMISPRLSPDGPLRPPSANKHFSIKNLHHLQIISEDPDDNNSSFRAMVDGNTDSVKSSTRSGKFPLNTASSDSSMNSSSANNTARTSSKTSTARGTSGKETAATSGKSGKGGKEQKIHKEIHKMITTEKELARSGKAPAMAGSAAVYISGRKGETNTSVKGAVTIVTSSAKIIVTRNNSNASTSPSRKSASTPVKQQRTIRSNKRDSPTNISDDLAQGDDLDNEDEEDGGVSTQRDSARDSTRQSSRRTDRRGDNSERATEGSFNDDGTTGSQDSNEDADAPNSNRLAALESLELSERSLREEQQPTAEGVLAYNASLRTMLMPSASLANLLVRDTDTLGPNHAAHDPTIPSGPHHQKLSHLDVDAMSVHSAQTAHSGTTNVGNISVSVTSMNSKTNNNTNSRQAAVGSPTNSSIGNNSYVLDDGTTGNMYNASHNMFYRHGMLSIASLEKLRPHAPSQFHNTPPVEVYDVSTGSILHAGSAYLNDGSTSEEKFPTSPSRANITNQSPFPGLHGSKGNSRTQTPGLQAGGAGGNLVQRYEEQHHPQTHAHAKQPVHRIGNTIVPTEVLSTRRPLMTRAANELAFLGKKALTARSSQAMDDSTGKFWANTELIGQHVYYGLEKPTVPGEAKEATYMLPHHVHHHQMVNHYLQHHHHHEESMHTRAAKHHASHFDDDVMSFYSADGSTNGNAVGAVSGTAYNGKAGSANKQVRGIGSLSTFKGSKSKKLAALNFVG
jgi:hypothetical protein